MVFFSRMQLISFILILVCPVAAQRMCAYLASPRNMARAQRQGRVSGFSQFCNRTDCCMGFFRLEDGTPRPDLLGCSVTERNCPELSCWTSTRHQNYISCSCRSDFCNLNITWIPGSTQNHTSQTTEEHSSVMVVVLAAVFFIVCICVTALMLKRLLKRNKDASHRCYNVEEPDIELQNVELQKVVACGHFACVWQGNLEGSPVALKVFPAGRKVEFNREKSFYKLPFMMNPGIIQFLSAGTMRREHVLVLELADQGSLNAFLNKTACSWASAVRLSRTLSEGLAYLHDELNYNQIYKPSIAHCDLSSSNVLVRADGSCALCDFSCSTMVLPSGKHRASLGFGRISEGRIQMGTLLYMAPEILEGSANVSSERCLLLADVYSLGLVLWEIFMRCLDLCTDCSISDHVLPYQTELGPSPSLQDLLIFVSEKQLRPSIPPQWHRVRQMPHSTQLNSWMVLCLKALWITEINLRHL